MQVSVKKKSSTEVEGGEAGYVDIKTPLPELVKRTVPNATPVATPTIMPAVTPPTVATAAKTEVTPATAPNAVVEPPRPRAEVANPIAEPQKLKPTLKRPSILSLGDLLKEEQGVVVTSKKGSVASVASNVDSASGEKLEAARGAIMGFLGEWRPRFSAVFEHMTISANVIGVVVPTTELRDEILRGKTEFLTKVVSLAGVKGVVELNIVVNEAEKSFRPIKLADRIAYIMGLNPLILELKEALDLDVEG